MPLAWFGDAGCEEIGIRWDAAGGERLLKWGLGTNKAGGREGLAEWEGLGVMRRGRSYPQ